MTLDHRKFYTAIRSMFRGNTMSQAQVDGINNILDECEEEMLIRQQTAYCLATAFHETGQRMTPVREGFASSDEGAIRAVTSLYRRGKISTNYALPHPVTGESYYGRGYVQLTWYDNYKKAGDWLGIDLVGDPDLAMEPKTSARILVEGMKRGAFTGKKLDDFSEPRSSLNFVNDRAIVNGRDRAEMIAGYAQKFDNALEGWKWEFGDEKSADTIRPNPPVLDEEYIRKIVREEIKEALR